MNSPRILYQDEALIVIDKPYGMIVNRADTAKDVVTLQDWMEETFKIHAIDLPVEEGNDFKNRSGLVHRLDKETSGIILAAKTPESFLKLQEQFREGRVSKTYTALVHGNVLQEEGEINAPIGRLPWNRMHFGVLPAGRPSQTFYKVIKHFTVPEVLTLVEAYPKTGRTHQIRVHFRYINHPLFADELYAGRKTSKKDRKLLARHFLHASKIQFNHPTTSAPVTFESPLPSELVDFLMSLQ